MNKLIRAGFVMIMLATIGISGCQHLEQDKLPNKADGCNTASALVAIEQDKMRMQDPTIELALEYCRPVSDPDTASLLGLVKANRVEDGNRTEDEFAALFQKIDGAWQLAGVTRIYVGWVLGQVTPNGVQNTNSTQDAGTSL